MSLGSKHAELRVRGSSVLEVPLPGDLFSCSWRLTSAGTQRQERSPDYRRVRFAGTDCGRVLRSWWEADILREGLLDKGLETSL